MVSRVTCNRLLRSLPNLELVNLLSFPVLEISHSLEKIQSIFLVARESYGFQA